MKERSWRKATPNECQTFKAKSGWVLMEQPRPTLEVYIVPYVVAVVELSKDNHTWYGNIRSNESLIYTARNHRRVAECISKKAAMVAVELML
jgi:hypothetical protein